MPAPDHLLASFVASWAGKVASTTAQNWMAGLHFWHNIHGAPWHGKGLLRTATAGLAKVVPSSSKRPRRPPVTIEHMHALFRGLDFSNAFDSAVFAVASVAFWCCCRCDRLHSPFHCINALIQIGRTSRRLPESLRPFTPCFTFDTNPSSFSFKRNTLHSFSHSMDQNHTRRGRRHHRIQVGRCDKPCHSFQPSPFC